MSRSTARGGPLQTAPRSPPSASAYMAVVHLNDGARFEQWDEEQEEVGGIGAVGGLVARVDEDEGVFRRVGEKPNRRVRAVIRWNSCAMPESRERGYGSMQMRRP